MVPVPDAVIARAEELLGADGAARWLRWATVLVEELVARHQLRDLEPLLGGRGGLLHQARHGDRTVTVKVPYETADGVIRAQQALEAAGVGPAVVAVHHDALILAHIDGTDARQHPRPAELIDQVADTLTRLADGPGDQTLPPLTDWLHQRITTTPRDVTAGSRAPTPAEAAHALRLLEELDGDETGPCHGDCGPGNVIVAPGRRLWLIDARGHRGDITYDLATYAYKTHDGQQHPTRAAQAAAHAARRCGLDPDRTTAWIPIIVAART